MDLRGNRTLSTVIGNHLHEPIIYPEQARGEVFKNIVNDGLLGILAIERFRHSGEILRLLLKFLLLSAERIKRTVISKGMNTEWFTTFNEFKDLLEKHYSSTRNANAYASLMSISYKHLIDVFKSLTGITAKAFIDQFIILMKKRRLAVSNASVKELTYAPGIDEPTNFLNTGKSPSPFKKKVTK